MVMRNIISIILTLALLLSCTACSGLLEREYTQVQEHKEQTAETDDATTLRAEGYAALVSSAQYFVTLGAPTGTIRLYQYSGDIQKAVDRVCRTLLQKDPLGAYALQDVQCSYTRIVSYYECVFTYSYRRTMDEIAAIRPVSGKGEFRQEIRKALEQFAGRLTLKSASYYQTVERVQQEFWEVFYDTPQAALATPTLTVSLYPEQGEARVVELEVNWPLSQQELQAQSKEVSDAAARLVSEEGGGNLTQAWLLYTRLRESTVWAADGSESVYSALVEGRANSEGIAMAYHLLCDRAGMECQVVRGTRNDQVHCWNLITVDGTSWQVDVTAGDGRNSFLHTDQEMGRVYSWSREDYPACSGGGSQTP